MTYHNNDDHPFLRTLSHTHNWDAPDFNLSHWQGHSMMFQHPLDVYQHDFNRPLPAHGHDWNREFESTPPAFHLTHDSTYPPYHSPGEDLQRPYYSSPSTLYNSSSASSDRLSPSIGSRASSLLPCSDPCQFEVTGPGLDHTSYSDGAYADAPCVAMQHVQKTADAMNEEPIEEYNGYDAYEPQELVPLASEDYEPSSSACHQLPIPIAQADTSIDESASEPEPELAPEPELESEYEPDPAPAARRSRARKQQPHAATKSINRVSKRPLIPTTTKASSTPRDTPRAFHCPLAPYGCPSAFNAKNEWKRHALTQHFRLGFWRCDQCTDSPERPNDFNRKDLFVQHVRRMHPTNAAMPSTGSSKKKGRANGRVGKVATVEAALNKIATRCYQRTLSAPESCACIFCEEKFEGEGAMEIWTEHVGKHMESRRKEGLDPVAVADWREDKELESWLLLHEKIGQGKEGLEVLK